MLTPFQKMPFGEAFRHFYSYVLIWDNKIIEDAHKDPYHGDYLVKIEGMSGVYVFRGDEIVMLAKSSAPPTPATYEKEFIAESARNGNPPRLLKKGLTPHERRARLREKAEAGEYKNDLFSTPEATGQTEMKF